jgi:hypothetical protein
MLASHTEDATMDIDAEIPVDRQQLKDLNRHEARRTCYGEEKY